ncbi:MAG TPA: D-alanyl-D-alanine carboxypeptidase family protein [Caulobacteraceae bacterium]
MTKARPVFRFPAPIAVAVLALHLGVAHGENASCEAGPRSAANLNARSVDHLAWSPFGRPETGWAIYEPLVAKEISTTCAPQSPSFAARVAAWQFAHRVGAAGVVDVATLMRMKLIWQARRPFVAASRRACPAVPEQSSLARANAAESFGGKTIFLQPRALADYRRMIAAARDELPRTSADRGVLSIFSGYRSPAYDEARCAKQRNCQGVTRASCSAHRTGLALDIYLGAAPGYAPDSSADANRLFISRTLAYRWLARNAERFGFANYPFEPWHWEWVRQAP